MSDSANLAMPFIEGPEAEYYVTHNEALRVLDTLVQLAVLDRDLASPPVSPGEGARWIVAASPSGAWSARAGHIAAWQDGAWQFSVPRTGWLVYVIDEGALLAWDGADWVDAVTSLTSLGALQNLELLGVGTVADEDNPFSAALNNALWAAKAVADGGDGDLRFKFSKEAAANTASLLFQDDFSGRAEIGLTGDDDFHFKVSADGSGWVDALILDKASGASKFGAGLFWQGALSPAMIAANQNDYAPAGASGALVLRLASDASRNLTGLAGGSSGRVMVLLNVGANPVVLKDADAASGAGNRFAFGTDLTLGAGQGAVLWYDAASSRWRLIGTTVAGGGGGAGTAATTSYDHTASGLAATNVQQAIDELADEKAPASHTHVATEISDSTAAGRALLTAANAAAQRSALGLGDAATKNTGTTSGTVAAGDDARITGAAQKASNLSDLASAATARTNLGLGDAATKNTGTTSGTVAAGDDARITGAAQKASNLSDLASASTARTNLGLGDAATKNTGTTSGTVAAGDDARVTGAAQKASNLSDLASVSTARTNLGLGALATKSAADLASADVTGNLAVSHLNGGTGAHASSFWAGDGAWRNAPANHAGIATGRYYHGPTPGGSLYAGGVGQNWVYWTPFFVPERTTFTEIGVRITTAGAGANIQLAVYRGAGGVPTAKLVNTGSISAATTGAKTAAISLTLDAGPYFFGINADNATLACNWAFTQGYPQAFVGTVSDVDLGSLLAGALTFGTWSDNPAPSLTSGVADTYPLIWLKK